MKDKEFQLIIEIHVIVSVLINLIVKDLMRFKFGPNIQNAVVCAQKHKIVLNLNILIIKHVNVNAQKNVVKMVMYKILILANVLLSLNVFHLLNLAEEIKFGIKMHVHV